MPDVIYGVTWNNQNVLNYTYDNLGRLTNKTIPLYSEDAVSESLNTTYTYYDVNDSKTTTLLKSTSTNGVTQTYEYDELGNITSIFYGADSDTFEYDNLNQLVRENLGYLDKTYTYEYVNGNIKYKHEYDYTTGTLPATPKKTIEYHYDDSSWSDVLTSVSEITYSTNNTSTASVYSVGGGVLDAPLETDNFAKSLLGNNCKKVDLFSASLVKGRGTVEDGGGILSSESNISINSTTNSSTLFSMEVDAIGNMSKFNGYDFNWNGRRLESISQNGVELISYKYNIDGQRVSKTVGNTTTEYFYNGDILAGQKTGDDVLIFMYDNNGDVFGFTYNGTPYYYIKNAQNDVYMIVDETGVAQVLYMYDAWGRVACYDGTDFGLATINPLMYRSYYIDVETGYFFYYLNSRYYLADLGRFISADGVLGVNQDMNEYNLFAYCSNDPVNNFDLNGCGKISNWFKSVGQKISNWWNSITPSSSITVPSTSQAIGKTSDIVLGTAEEITSSYTRTNFCKIKYSKDYSPSSTVTILDGKTTKPYSRASKIAKGGATVITSITLALDLGNTWTENNSNTNGDRVLKSVVQVTGVAAGILVGAAASAAFAACAAVPVVGVVAFGAVTITGGIVIDAASNWYYNKVGID